MLVEIEQLLDHKQLADVQKLIEHAPFIDGKLSAGDVAQDVKNNQELDPNAAQLSRLNNIVMQTLVQNPRFQRAVLPHRIASPFYAKYNKGEHYGEHIDDPIMGPANQRYRSDVSITVFLNSPAEYEGGELCIKTDFGTQEVKLEAGHAILYPSSSLHLIKTVTQGERRVAVTWAQSMVRDTAQRTLLFELSEARESLLKSDPISATSKQVDHCYVNLVRMWSDL